MAKTLADCCEAFGEGVNLIKRVIKRVIKWA